MFGSQRGGSPPFFWPVPTWELFRLRGERGSDLSTLAFRLAKESQQVVPPLPEAMDKGVADLLRDAPRCRVWEPLKDTPALYREAASVNWHDPVAVLEWVNRRGMLWWFNPTDSDHPGQAIGGMGLGLATGREGRRRPPFPFEQHRGRPFLRWGVAQKEIATLCDAVAIHQALHGHGRISVSEDLRWTPWIRFRPQSWEEAEWATKAARGHRRRDLLELSWMALWQTVATRLNLKDNLQPFFAIPPRRRVLVVRKQLHVAPDLVVRLRPSSLAACLWWQFYLDAFRRREHRLCPGPGDEHWFAPKRVDQRTCERTACRDNERQRYQRDLMRVRRLLAKKATG